MDARKPAMATPMATSVIEDLESALAAGSSERRVAMLHRVTDLFLSGASAYSENQTSLFDQVMNRLVDHIETRTMAEVSARLAPVPNAPAGMIRRMAYDDEISVSGPVLAQSEQLTDEDLVEIAASKSQEHLAKIAIRRHLNETVTDVLVDRGDIEVASALAGNEGARLSSAGMSKLVILAETDESLTEIMGLRSDMPPYLFQQLMAHATKAARDRLLARAKPSTRAAIEQVAAEIATQVGATKVNPRAYAEAQRLMQSLSQDTALTHHKLLQFTSGNRIAELVAALAVLTGVPIEFVHRILHAPSVYGTLVLCKAVALEWPITESVIAKRPGVGRSREADLDEARAEYPKLSPASAQRLMRFWLVRQKVA
jgi:uncharacterized protein (DUF2336 family)